METGKKKLLFVAVVAFLVIGNVYFFARAASLAGELSAAKNEIDMFHRDEKIVSFLGMFVDKVLKSGSEVDFENRLMLENAVRATEDKEIVSQWQKFTASKTEIEAQEEVRKLLEISIGKISREQ